MCVCVCRFTLAEVRCCFFEGDTRPAGLFFFFTGLFSRLMDANPGALYAA